MGSHTGSFDSGSKCRDCWVEVLHDDHDGLYTSRVNIRDIQTACSVATSKPIVFFARAHSIRECPICCPHFSNYFKIPDSFWTGYCKRSNGFFGCESNYDSKGKLEAYNTWFRFLIKQTFQESFIPPNKKDYLWYKLNIFTRHLPSLSSGPSKNIILCFDPPDAIRKLFQGPLLQELGEKGKYDPFGVHSVFVKIVAGLQDDAVWGIRNLVRSTEIGRTPSKYLPDPRYEELHDMSRHSIHVLETLDVAMITLSHIQNEHSNWLSSLPPPSSPSSTKSTAISPATPKSDHDSDVTKFSEKIRKDLTFHEHLLGSLRFRAASNKERLVNEITLAFHTVAQYDSRISVQIGQAAQADSAAMKTIAFLTLVFLPATFISAIFSTSFFNFSPPSHPPDGWSVSPKFWVYWAVAVPLSIVTVVLWIAWGKWFQPRAIGEEVAESDGDDDGDGKEDRKGKKGKRRRWR